MAKTPGEIAIELRGKFEFYLLALIFSILGLSIQTAHFGGYLAADALELSVWLALFIAGVVGIVRGEWIPVAYDIQSKIHSTDAQRGRIRDALGQGVAVQVPFIEENGQQNMVPGQQAIGRLDQLLTTLEQQHTDVHKRVIRRYGVMRTAFLVGIVCLLGARGVAPALAVVSQIRGLLR